MVQLKYLLAVLCRTRQVIEVVSGLSGQLATSGYEFDSCNRQSFSRKLQFSVGALRKHSQNDAKNSPSCAALGNIRLG